MSHSSTSVWLYLAVLCQLTGCGFHLQDEVQSDTHSDKDTSLPLYEEFQNTHEDSVAERTASQKTTPSKPSIRRLKDAPSLSEAQQLPQRIPRNSNWLLNPIQGQFGSMPVDQLLTEILPQPIRFSPMKRRPMLSNMDFREGTSLLEALDRICAVADLHWEITDKQTVAISPTVTKAYRLLAQPGQSASSLAVNALSGDQQSEEGEGTSMTYSSNPYEEEIKPLIQQLIQGDQDNELPSRMVLLPAANTLVVTARPSTHRKIDTLLDEYNERIASVVRIYIAMYEVSTSSKTSVGSKLEALNGSAQLGFSARSIDSSGAFRITVDRPSSPWFGTTQLLDFLDQHGRARIALQDQIEVRNNHVASTSETRTFQYLSTLTREQDQLGRERVSVDHDELRTGWSLGIQPTIGLDAITLRLSLARRALVEERPYEFGSTAGTTFVTDDFTRTMSITLPAGETRLITSLSSRNQRQNKSRFLGIPISRAWDRRRTESLLWVRVELVE